MGDQKNVRMETGNRTGKKSCLTSPGKMLRGGNMYCPALCHSFPQKNPLILNNH